ncbi:MAG: capsule assembly Wzi family protein [Nitrospirota bacterium]
MALLVTAPAFAAEPHLPTDDLLYRRLEWLAALGLVNEGLLGTRPLTKDALGSMLREIRINAAGSSDPWITADVQTVERRLVSMGSMGDARFEGRFVQGDGPAVPTGIERHGDQLSDGGNARVGASLGGSLSGWLAWGYHPELRYPVGVTDDLDLAARSAYVELAGKGLALTVGRESLWWGPGYRGTLLVTDHAAPFDLVRVETSRPWYLKWIGPMSAHVFVTRLEADRLAIPRPFLAGFRLAFRPWPELEFGLSRTAMFGGEGRPVTAGLIWDVIRAKGENDTRNPGNQLGGIDATIRIPWRPQPVALYLEWAGEDEANGFPSHPAVVAGVYLPTLAGSSQWSLRTEWADNAFADVPGIWYQHAVYQSGYTYQGVVIGHPMGTDARMLSMELDRRVTPEWMVSALYDAVTSGVFGPGETSGRSPGVRLVYESATWSTAMEYRYTRMEEPLGPSHDDGHVVSFSVRTGW